MIADFIIDLFLAIPNLILDSLPDVSGLVLPQMAITGINTLFHGIGWLLPLRWLWPILASSIAIQMFRIGWAILLRIKSFIPTMGN